MSKIQDFCRKYFKTELTEQQLKMIDAVADSEVVALKFPRQQGVTFANKVIRAYLRDGLKDPVRLDHLFIGTEVTHARNSGHRGRVIGTRLDPQGYEYHVQWDDTDRDDWFKRSALVRIGEE